MRFDPRQFDLARWAEWVAAGKPVHFSLYGDSTAGKPYEARHKRTYQDDKPLWREGGADRLVEIDNRLHGALRASERRILLAACVPMGRICPATERAAAAGVDVETLRAIRRRAMQLID